MSFSDCKSVAALCAALDHSIEFYSAAAESASVVENRNIFQRIAKARSTILAHLEPFTYHDHCEPEFYAFGSVLQKVYPDMFCELNNSSDPALVTISQQTEAELYELLKKTLTQVQTPLLQALLIDLFPELNGFHPMCFYDQAG